MLDLLAEFSTAKSVAAVHDEVLACAAGEVRAIHDDHEVVRYVVEAASGASGEETLRKGAVCLAVEREQNAFVLSVRFRLLLLERVDGREHFLAGGFYSAVNWGEFEFVAFVVGDSNDEAVHGGLPASGMTAFSAPILAALVETDWESDLGEQKVDSAEHAVGQQDVAACADGVVLVKLDERAPLGGSDVRVVPVGKEREGVAREAEHAAV